MPAPRVDVIIPVHSASRPIARAVASVLDGSAAAVRVIVIAHNIESELIRSALLDVADDPAVEVIHLADGIPSPAGPRNLGITHATAPYYAFLDSDDTLAPGALDSWLTLAEESHSAVVIARMEQESSGAADPLPPTRPERDRALHPVKDRLPYRSAPFGLIDRERFAGLRFTPGLESGEDIVASAELWFSGARIAYDRTGPAYRVGGDASDRVTAARRSLAADFAFLGAIAATEWFGLLPRSARRAFGVKVFRLHFFDAVLARLTDDGVHGGLDAHREPFARLVHQVEELAPGSLALLSRRDRAAIDEATSPTGTPETIMALLEARWLGGIDAMLTRNPFLSMHRQGPRRTLRDMVA
ncbi:Dolichol-phosphate mannosyltransferase in lipid-linked oligosaccharide synthesis cluster [Leucobacter sp. 7(1)]|uniref:glycosyltransferase family 2 protein n=1 Tax=Leucobacter sp. 7(1) TaxID=1255613 RepID=UPI00097F6383|nr:glycosyltransferase family 2 protein [Leucobacter sp. 7(1)]SJN13352.1 Dolichol-phosphate mannosyltransferase in lipid-linked oligosaccharide synthesis cluster [Leucobacter sp. 7(1)]